jgi:hypothetical protein
MSECLKAAVLAQVGVLIGVGATVFCSWMNYKLAMATLQTALRKAAELDLAAKVSKIEQSGIEPES